MEEIIKQTFLKTGPSWTGKIVLYGRTSGNSETRDNRTQTGVVAG